MSTLKLLSRKQFPTSDGMICLTRTILAETIQDTIAFNKYCAMVGWTHPKIWIVSGSGFRASIEMVVSVNQYIEEREKDTPLQDRF